MNVDEFDRADLTEIDIEDCAKAVNIAKGLINRASVALRVQGYPLGRYEEGSISGELISAFSGAHTAERMIRELDRKDRGTVPPPTP